MKKQPFLDLLKETFEDPTKMTPEKVKRLAEEVPVFFSEVQQKFFSNDPQAQKEAEELLSTVKMTLEGQLDKLVQMTGFSLDQLSAMAKDPKFISKEERTAIDEMNQKLTELNTTPHAKPSKKKKSRLRLRG